MAWLTDRNCFFLAVIFYGFSAIYSIFLWRQGFRQDNRINYLLLLTGCLFHTGAMILRGFSLNRCPINNLYEATLFVAWTMVATYLVLGLWRRLRFLGAFTSPLLFAIGVFALMPELDAKGPEFAFKQGWSSLHAALILLAYGAFGLGSAASLMYLFQVHDLKHNKLRAVTSLMPPIARLEMVTGRLLAFGFALLTIGLVVGSLWLKQTDGVYLEKDPKILWSMVVWLLYLLLILLHWCFNHRGRRFAWGVVAAFAFLGLTFWGSNLLSSIHNP